MRNPRLATLFHRLAVCSLLFATSVSPAVAAERFTVSHARQTGDQPASLRVYLDALGEGETPLTGLAATDLSATIGENRGRVDRLEPFEGSGEGVAYIFLVDISKSLTPRQFDGIREALSSWVGDLEPKDWGAVIAFGSESRVVVDFTQDKNQLQEGLASLGPTDNRTLLHRALFDALELSQRRDEGIPGRRVLAVLTDGLDEGSGLALEDVVEKLREDPVPIHAIGYSRLRPDDRRQTFLAVLKRLATVSGGSFFEAQRTEFAESYGAIRQAIRRVWVADVVCPSCRSDGRVYRLQLNLSTGQQVLSRGTDVRLLPLPTLATPGASADSDGDGSSGSGSSGGGSGGSASNGSGVGEEGSGSRQSGSDTAASGAGEPVGRWQSIPWWLYALAAVLFVLLAWLVTRPAKPGEEEDSLLEGSSAGVPSSDEKGPKFTPSVPAQTNKDFPEVAATSGSVLKLRSLRLIVVRGSRKGKEYKVSFRERAVVGARSTCDCVLGDEPGIAPEQFEITQENGQFYVKNLAPGSPTRMGGHTLNEPRRLKSNDLIGTSETILRIVLET
ncbi:MAG: VWA domain-containing protein [Deltaproteobacteria bacterium]|nr:VWA domain-containing protein [Deltaproteobacteria bacterium]